MKRLYKLLPLVFMSILLFPVISCSDENLGETIISNKFDGKYSFRIYLDYTKGGETFIENTSKNFNKDMSLALPHTVEIKSTYGEPIETNVKGVIVNKKCYLEISGQVGEIPFTHLPDISGNKMQIKFKLPSVGDRTDIITADCVFFCNGDEGFIEFFNVGINDRPVSETKLPYYTISLD